MRELIELLKTKDHFEVLKELSEELYQTHVNIDEFIRTLEMDECIEYRAELPVLLVRSYILNEVLKVKFNVMPDEWNSTIDKVVETLIEENKPKNKFDDMDF